MYFFRASSFIGCHFVGTNNIFFSVSNILTNNVSVLRNDAEKITWNFHGVSCITRHNSKFNCVLRGVGEISRSPYMMDKEINRCKPSQFFFPRNDNLKFPWETRPPFSLSFSGI